jgi:membrane-bound ClpP family serine protease
MIKHSVMVGFSSCSLEFVGSNIMSNNRTYIFLSLVGQVLLVMEETIHAYVKYFIKGVSFL